MALFGGYLLLKWNVQVSSPKKSKKVGENMPVYAVDLLGILFDGFQNSEWILTPHSGSDHFPEGETLAKHQVKQTNFSSIGYTILGSSWIMFCYIFILSQIA